MYLTKEKLQELYDTGIDEKIQKFATLFPNGTDVTREICVEHPDVFSFGLPGARLLPPHVRWKPYWEKVCTVQANYMSIMRFTKNINLPPSSTRSIALYEIQYGKPFMPTRPGAVSMTFAEGITRRCNCSLALIFHEASSML